MVCTYIYIVIGLCTQVMRHEILSNKKSGFSISNHSGLNSENLYIEKYEVIFFFNNPVGIKSKGLRSEKKIRKKDAVICL